MGAMVGHVVAQVEHLRIEFEDLIRPEFVTEFERDNALNIANFLKEKPSYLVEFQIGFVRALHNTFDQYGSQKETPLTPVYKKILSDWPEIELFSGPKELCEFLSPMLGNQHFEDKYERVKAICKRMQITFSPSVKGR